MKTAKRTVCNPKGVRHHPDAMVLQSYIFDKGWLAANHLGEADVRAWLRERGLRWALDEKSGTFRARQIDPACFIKTSYRTIRIAPGIQAAVAKLKK